MRERRFLIIEICSHIADVRIRQTNNLPRVTWISKDFLVSGETGVENDFAATPRDCPRSASLKNSSIFQCKNALPYDSLCQRIISRRATSTARTRLSSGSD